MPIRSKSHILKLPTEILQEVDRMLLAVGPERKTYREVIAWLADKGYTTSLPALSRYFRYIRTLDQVNITAQQVKAILDEVQQSAPLELEEGVSKLCATLLMEAFQEAFKEGGGVNVKKIGRLVGDFAKLQASSVARAKFQQDYREKVEQALKRIEHKTKKAKKSLDPETRRIIREEVYGLI